jgi:tubulysin polyketide synthase-like protein
MSPLDLFLHLCAAGCQLTRQGDTLRVHDPQHILTDALRQAIRTHKAALLAVLTPEPLTQYYPCVVCSGSERWDDAGIWRCLACWPSPERQG